MTMTYAEARQLPVGSVFVPFGGTYLIIDEKFDDGTAEVGICPACGHGVVEGKAARRCTDGAAHHIYDCRNDW